MSKFDSLFTQGFYFGKIEDVVSDYSEFLRYAEDIRALSKDKSKWNFQNIASDESLPHLIPAELKNERLKIVAERNLTSSCKQYQLISERKYHYLYNYFDDVVKKIAQQIYPTVDNNIYLGGSVQLFEDGDYLDTHTDGYMNGFCTVVIYLSDIENYNGSGKLVMVDHNETCDPILGNYSIFELTKNDVRHKIDMVTEKFQRLSYLVHVIQQN